ncbi:MAG: uracil-DNA glycosylase family protein [Planctomycetota bacterium]|jgi:uracil-DNA glycosylase
MSSDSFWIDRGYPWEYDPGPAKNLSWARLLSETPNYRQLSKTALGNEKFRWHFGPMYYRGRLKPNAVRVVIVGQEGAQDESLAHRSFVGGTGARMQHFLNFIGINYSYLFVNTFVYPIFGQYTDSLKWLAQDLQSPIVRHRHDIFNYILKKNDVRLIVAVGNAAKESVKTWVESRGGVCPNGIGNLSTCTGHFLDPKTKIVGVLHPGGAGKGGSTNTIKASFQSAVNKIKNWSNQESNWLPCDSGCTRNLSQSYTYGKDPIPFRDLPFGITWRIGRGGTSSNRKDSQRSIQLFSAGGKYNNKGDSISYTDLAKGTQQGYSEGPGDVPYEPPVHRYKDYDKGPGSAFAKLFMGTKKGLEWPDFEVLGVNAHASLGYGAIFRGRPAQATVLILADQQSHSDLFTARALSGEGGQRLQAFLSAMGITKRYCILRVLPVDASDLTVAKRKSIATDPQIVKVYDAILKKLLNRKKTKFILTVGSVSGFLIDQLDTGNLDIIKLKAWTQSEAKQDWQQALATIKNKKYAKDIKNPSFAYGGERLQIPGYDLPYGTLKWQASSGDRARRAKLANGKWSPDYYKFIMPEWAYNLDPPPLSPKEQKAIQNHP